MGQSYKPIEYIEIFIHSGLNMYLIFIHFEFLNLVNNTIQIKIIWVIVAIKTKYFISDNDDKLRAPIKYTNWMI